MASGMRGHPARNRIPAITDDGLGGEWQCRPGAGGELNAIRLNAAGNSTLARSYNQLVAGGIQVEHIERRRPRDANSATLANRVMDQTGMFTDGRAVFGDDGAGTGHIGSTPGNEISVGRLAHEADLLALFLVGHR